MPRTKTVTPGAPAGPPDDDLEELLAAAESGRRRPSGEDSAELSLTTASEIAIALRVASHNIRATVAHIALIPVARATPEERSQLVDLRQLLDAARADLSTWVDAIDIGFRRAAAELGAEEIVLADGVVKVHSPRGEWVVNVPMLKEELKELAAHGLLSPEELASIFDTKVTETANNSRLNYFAKKRGAEIAAAIERSRAWKDGNAANARVVFQRRADA